MKNPFFVEFFFILAFGVLFLVAQFVYVWPFSLAPEKLHHILDAYIAFNIALIGLIPVTTGLIVSNIEKTACNKRKKKVKDIAFGFVDANCSVLIVWCAILLIFSIIVYITDSSFLFMLLSAFELAVLLFWVLWSVVSLSRTWPRMYIENMQQQE